MALQRAHAHAGKPDQRGLIRPHRCQLGDLRHPSLRHRRAVRVVGRARLTRQRQPRVSTTEPGLDLLHVRVPQPRNLLLPRGQIVEHHGLPAARPPHSVARSVNAHHDSTAQTRVCSPSGAARSIANRRCQIRCRACARAATGCDVASASVANSIGPAVAA